MRRESACCAPQPARIASCASQRDDRCIRLWSRNGCLLAVPTNHPWTALSRAYHGIGLAGPLLSCSHGTALRSTTHDGMRTAHYGLIYYQFTAHYAIHTTSLRTTTHTRDQLLMIQESSTALHSIIHNSRIPPSHTPTQLCPLLGRLHDRLPPMRPHRRPCGRGRPSRCAHAQRPDLSRLAPHAVRRPRPRSRGALRLPRRAHIDPRLLRRTGPRLGLHHYPFATRLACELVHRVGGCRAGHACVRTV